MNCSTTSSMMLRCSTTSTPRPSRDSTREFSIPNQSLSFNLLPIYSRDTGIYATSSRKMITIMVRYRNYYETPPPPRKKLKYQFYIDQYQFKHVTQIVLSIRSINCISYLSIRISMTRLFSIASHPLSRPPNGVRASAIGKGNNNNRERIEKTLCFPEKRSPDSKKVAYNGTEELNKVREGRRKCYPEGEQ